LKAKPGRSLWKDDKLPILILVERGGLELYIPSIDVRGETIGRIASRHVEQGSRICIPLKTMAGRPQRSIQG